MSSPLEHFFGGFPMTNASTDDPASIAVEPTLRQTGGYPPWLDREMYPFDSHYVDLGPGRMHYVDEGEGRPVLMLHGDPTWSFLYRHLIDGLSAEYRCIAPDYFGFGLSQKPRYWSYRPEDHARTIEAFIEELELEDVTLVVHDWGGPIGLSYAEHNPENVHSLVITNTLVWPVDDEWRFRLYSNLLGGPIGRFFGKRYNFYADRAVSMGFADRSRLTDSIKRHYLEPLADPQDRRGTWTFARAITDSSPWLADLWRNRSALTDIPALICWGMADRLVGSDALRTWQALYPDARTITYPAAGHLLQEEVGGQLTDEIGNFLGSV